MGAMIGVTRFEPGAWDRGCLVWSGEMDYGRPVPGSAQRLVSVCVAFIVALLHVAADRSLISKLRRLWNRLRRDPVRRPHSSSGLRRIAFFELRARLASTRRRRDAAVGRVGFRGAFGVSAAARSWASRRRATSRLRACDRVSSADTVTTPPRIRDASLAATRCFWAALSAREESTANDTSARVADRLACWPPGPPDVLNFQLSSSSGMVTPSITGRSAMSAA